MEQVVTVVGGGLAGSECALQLARRGVRVRLFEQRPTRPSPAHHGAGLAELVCSNSLKSTKPDTAAGLLKWELERLGSELLRIARECSVPAGGALAVDRELFSRAVTERVAADPLIELVREEVTTIPEGPCVIAAGPLCSDALFSAIAEVVGGERMSFFDAAAPIVDAESLDRSLVFEQSRYGEEGSGDYLNCPMTREEYDAFMGALLGAERVIARDFEQADLFCACQPVEEVARTGHDSLRFGALKPVGLTDPRTGRRPWAAVQLRAENASRTAYNLVGFQTNLTWPEQRRVFRMIPGLGEAEFLRYGVMHRNSFVDAPRALDATFAVPGTSVRLAGQITGTEGYVEAIASGLLAALNTAAELSGKEPVRLPATGALGALVAYATDPATSDYQPMHVNFGLVPPLADPPRNKAARREALAARARADLDAYLASRPDLLAGA
ncbi:MULTISPECIES: methylenetetrahydrofolate--tRNA-(uracil(54)-C(5))-methyltransferase (FADH(2)-oxidizing) TrmFO [Atopobiaceae]|uniref:methylenetetrahydrofolate--tRNA-(uracil(54)- C(5))-methyltransferase (FADH(2)-oxidizing) TrmFO n=1 Tax=Atopobiaceae TaxID=1643824 RepID=UPI000B3A6287|nr:MULTISPECIES: methylenetetrahydrofolate--tRNA-(uracil(54)-C(5))-methyltransferase (FADH(2)-oxidizing) TrmFO [Atopobiaceae]MCR8908769.1 methylenetetrahydrofolate--tRNA-(uracil(54)-C(5))-methyltransferase (FADH(2)-oxidizing) TrmFO [Thermophilibacter sp. ET337]OUO32672.1 methylenetetrahydrofolate--tRNA-(uracil(54)-C(5))-methyltransferase (FADH(2)-oxidizing) TrmFO [Olsenella sp. An293]